MNKILQKLRLKKAKTVPADGLAAFLRETPSSKQKKVFLDAARRAAEDQRAVLYS